MHWLRRLARRVRGTPERVPARRAISRYLRVPAGPSTRPRALPPHVQAVLAEFDRRGDATAGWIVLAAEDLRVDERGILVRLRFRRHPEARPCAVEALVCKGRVARVRPVGTEEWGAAQLA